jgi:hypothetical protein
LLGGESLDELGYAALDVGGDSGGELSDECVETGGSGNPSSAAPLATAALVWSVPPPL